MEQTSINQASDRWFFFTLLYIIFDYGRPQDIIPPIGSLRPLMFITAVLVYYIVTSGMFYKTKSPQMKLIWMFCLLLSVYIPFARNNFFAFGTTRSMLLFIPFILSTIICVNSIKRLTILINTYIILLIYISCYSLFHKGAGSGNYFRDENDLALYFNAWLPFCYFLFLHESRVKKKLLYGLGLILGILGVVVSFSRGGLVGLLCLGLFAWLFSSRKMISLLLIVIIAGTFYISVPDRYLARMSTISKHEQGTALERRLSWKAAWSMFLDKPWGVGGNNFQVWFSKYQPPEMKRGMYGRDCPFLMVYPHIGTWCDGYYHIRIAFILQCPGYFPPQEITSHAIMMTQDTSRRCPVPL